MENKKESENINFININSNNNNNINNDKENSYQNKHINKQVFSNIFFEFGPNHSRFLKFKEANNLFKEYNNFLSHLKLMNKERNIKTEKIYTETKYVYDHLTQISKDDNDKDLFNINNNDKNLFFPTQINIPKRNIKTFSNESQTLRNNRYSEENKINNNNYFNKNNRINTSNFEINNIKYNYNKKYVILKGRNKLKNTDIENMCKLSIKDLTTFVPDVNKTRRMLLESYEMKEKMNRSTKPAFHIK